MTKPTQLILHVQDFSDALTGPFNNYQEIEDHIETLQQFNPGAEVQAIYPIESLKLEYMLKETISIPQKDGPPKIIPIYSPIRTPQEDIDLNKKAWEFPV